MARKIIMILILSIVLFALLAIMASSKMGYIRTRPSYSWTYPLYEPTYGMEAEQPETVYYAGYGQVCGLISRSPRIRIDCLEADECVKFTPNVGFCGVKKDFKTVYSQFY